MTTSEEAVADVISHYGTKGMRWGVVSGNDGSQTFRVLTKSDMLTDKVRSNPAHKAKMTGRAIDKGTLVFNKVDLPVLNRSEKYAGKDLISNKKLGMQYQKDATKMWSDRVTEQLQIHLQDPKKTPNHPLNALHSDVPLGPKEPILQLSDYGLKFVFDELGFITGVVGVDEAFAQADEAVENILSHHGIKGQKWGIRRKPKPGSDTVGGPASEPPRTEVRLDLSGPTTRASIRRRKDVTKRLRTLSDEEIKSYIQRLDQEKKLKSMLKADISPGKEKVNAILTKAGTDVLQNALTAAGTHAVAALVSDKMHKPGLGKAIGGKYFRPPALEPPKPSTPAATPPKSSGKSKPKTKTPPKSGAKSTKPTTYKWP